MSGANAGFIRYLDSERGYFDEQTNQRFDAVTTIISATTSKPWLTTWSAGFAAEYAIDNLDLLASVITSAGRDPAVALVKKVAEKHREAAADRGTFVHDLVEALSLDAPLPTFGDMTDEARERIDSITDGFLAFVTDFDADIEMSEATVADRDLLVAGTLDLIAYLRAARLRLVIDTKTGANLEHTWKAQLAAYRHMKEVWLPQGQHAPMPETDGFAILHLRPEYDRGYKLRVVTDPDDDAASYRWFLDKRTDYLRQRAATGKPGRVLYPPQADGTQPPPLIEDIETDGFGRARGPLKAAGLRRLDELAVFTARDCLRIKGIGAKLLLACEATLTAHGLAFAPDPLVESVAS